LIGRNPGEVRILMTSFVPPYPPRPSEPLSLNAALQTARRNFIAVFDEKCFDDPFFSTRILNRRLFVCNSPDTVAQAFIALHDSFERKTPQMHHALTPLLGDGLFVSDGETWKQRRRMVAPIVHASRLSLFAPIIVEAAAETAERWARLPPSAPIDALREIATLTAEIICRAVFGPRLGSEHANTIVASFSEYQRVVGQLDLAYLLGLPDWLPRFHAPSIRRAARQIHRVLDHIIDQCKGPQGEGSMIRLLLDARDPETGEALGEEALRNEAAVIFMAGHETTANSLAWTWYRLSQAPEAEAWLHAELAQVLGGRLPTLADVPQLVYTRAVFDEAIRLYPPAPVLGRQAMHGETIRDQPIPVGSLLLVVPWLLHRHRSLCARPDHFVPDRFLPENAGARERYSYIPFSVGPRVCAGQAFGQTEAILCVATLAQRVRMQLAAGAVVEPVCRLTLRPGKTPSGIEIRGHLRRLVRRIRKHWSATRITIRGDGHYGRPEVMEWCVDFIFGLPGNAVLDRLVDETADDIRTRRALDQKPCLRGFAETSYQAKSWNTDYRACARIEATTKGLDIRFVVTSIEIGSAEHIYETLYCARG
jgi:cytochrome P450